MADISHGSRRNAQADLIYGDLLLAGPLARDDLRARVLGADLPAHRVALRDARLRSLAPDTPIVWPEAGPAQITCVCLPVLPPQARARLSFYLAAFGAALRCVQINGAAYLVAAPAGDGGSEGADAGADGAADDAPDRVPYDADVILRASDELMRMMGQMTAKQAGAKWGLMLARAASAKRAASGANAAAPAIATQRSRADVQPQAQRQPYSNFFTVAEHDLTFTTFGGAPSAQVTRAAFVMCDAVTLLPYDPVRDRLLVVEQFRFGPFARGDHAPWSIEPIAGRIDHGESPEQAAMREAREEAAITPNALEFIGEYYPSPGAVTEYLYSYIALADLPDQITGIGGLEEEAEDIKSTLVDFEAAMAMLGAGQLRNGPLILSLLWLAQNRARLRAR